MGWGEAIRLVRRLRADPSSELAAEIEGWEFPVSREAAILMDHFDLTAAATGTKRPPKYPRGWKTKGESQHLGTKGGLPVEDVLARLGRAPVELTPPV